MADVKTNQSKVYNALKGMGFSGIGANESEFANLMAKPQNREKVYNALSSKGYKGIGKDLAAFDSLIYQAPTQQPTVQQPTQQPQAEAQPQHTGQVQKPVQFQNSLQQRMYPNGKIPTKPVMQSAATQSQPTEKKQPQQVEQPKQQPSGPYKPTDMERMAFGANMGGIQYTIDNATKGIDQIEQSAKKASPFGSGNVGLGNNRNLRKGKQTFDAEKGAFVDTYLTSDGREFRDVQQANNVQAELDNNADVIRYNNAMKSLGMGDISEERDKPIEQRLKEAYTERMELQSQLSEIAKRETSSRKGPRFPSMVGGSMETYSMSEESKNLSSALRLLERRITALEAERDDKGQSMFLRGTADTLKDPSAYSLGLTDLADTGVMSELKAKLDAVNGDVSQLSDTEKTLVRNYMMNQEAQRLNENRGNMYGFGQMFGQSLPFMAEFYLTGGFMGIGSAGTRLGTKAGLKVAGSELGKQMTKNLGGRVLLKTGQSLLKGTGRVGGALVGGALQSNTIGAAKTYSDIANRNMGNLTIDDKGNLDFSDGEGIAESFLKGQLINAFENGSELLGPAFDFAPNYLARVIKNKVAGGAINKMLSNKAWRGTNKFLRKLGVQGLFGEGMEEEANNIGNVLIGESNWFKDPNDPNKPAFFDGEEQFKTWAGVALTGAILRGPALAVGGYQKAQYYANKYNLNSSESQMRYVLGDYPRYQNIKAMLEGATNENIGSVLNSIVRGGQLNNQEKEAVVMYAQDLVNLRGFNIGSVVAEAVGATPKPQVANYNIRGLHVDEVDKDGNVLASHDYENADDLKAGLYELQQQRFDDNLQSDLSIMKTRPSEQYDQLVIDYLSQANLGMELSEFETILAKPSLERTEEEQQLVAPFADLLHNTVYDNTMLHEEQSQQDGEEIADADSIDIEAPSDDGMNLNTQWMNAQANRNNLFTQDENLKQEVELMESQGLSHQEIISRLDWARPEQVQGMIDYYNTKAKYEAYINRKAQKIDEAASNARQRHTMKGTIDGVADVNNVRTITDGTNKYYLVSGDITTDPATGRITGSNSGLIIGMDENGDFVQISDADGYSVLPVSMSLDQWEEAERTRLQEQITQVIDPNQTMNQQLNQPQPTGEQAGAQAGASTGTGANEAPAAPLSSEPQQPQQHAVAIQDVADKDGIKRYEQGIPVDDAIADIQNDGFDVNEVADASIAEAQQAIDKINGKPTKTRKDLMDRKSAQDVITYYNNVKARWAEMNQPAEDELHLEIPQTDGVVYGQPFNVRRNRSGNVIGEVTKTYTNNDGHKVTEVVFIKNGEERTDSYGYIEGLPEGYEFSGTSAEFFEDHPDVTILGVHKLKEHPRMKVPDGRLNDEQLYREQDAVADIVYRDADGQLQIDTFALKKSNPEPLVAEQPAAPSTAGLTVEEQKQQRIAEAKAKYGELFDDDFTKANDAYELASMWVGRKRNLAWEDVNGKRGLQKELGWTRKIGGDTKYIETLLAKNGEGMGVDEFVHLVWESPENDVNGEKRYSTEEIKEALLDLLKSAQSKSDVVDYALNTRIAQADAALQQQQQMQQEAATQSQQAEQPDVEIPDGGLPFAPATDEDFTNDVNETQEITNNNVSLQSENNTDNERKEVESHERGSDGINGAHEAATSLLQGINIEPDSERQGSRSKERLLDELEKSARAAGQWIDDDISTIGEYELGVGGENEVYTTEGNDVIKLNNFNFLRDDATNFEDFLNRLESFNELFPDVALRIVGFAKNSKGEVCVVMMQPAVFDNREATEEEIDKALEDRDFYTDITGNWTDGRYVISDLKPNNVLVDKEGNLHFIDVVTFDSTKPGQMMKAKKPATPEQEQPKQEEQDDYLQPRNAEEEQIIADVHQQLQREIGKVIEEQDKARSELQKAQARESERSSDLFGNDNALNQPGQLFDNSDMPIDNSKEGIDRRTSAEREQLQDVTNRLNQLQSEQERNSRIRSALDNHRRQTKIDTGEQPQTQSREDYLASHPLTEEQIMADTEATEDEKLNAIDFLNGEDSVISRFYYDQIYERAQKKADTIAKRKARFQGKEEKSSETNPMAAIEKAADEFRAEQERKAQDQQDIDDALKEFNDFLDNAKGSSVLDKFMRKGLEGNDKAQTNLLDAFTLTNEAQRMFLKDLLRLASKVGYAYIKSGVHDVQAWSKKMSDSIGAKLREVLGWDDAIIGEFVDEVWNQRYTVDGQRMRLSEHAERLKNTKPADQTVNEHKTENNEPQNVVSSQQELTEEEKEARFKFVNVVSTKLSNAVKDGEKPFRSIIDIRKLAQDCGMEVNPDGKTDILLQELVEDALVKSARKITQAGWGDPLDRKMYDEICKLYDMQPTISQRSSNRIKMQQYSTPLPMAFVADRFITQDGLVKGDVLEPTAGNGMLVIGINPRNVHANELDKTRLDNLKGQKFKKVTNQDATQPFEGDEQYSAVIANPPFGSAEAKEYDGKMITGLEEQIAINALSKMKDDGKAAIIIGGKTEYATNGAIKNNKAFVTYLYDHYNVKAIVDMDGKLYQKQGTTYPTRLILIDGRRSEEERAQTKVYPPTIKNYTKKAMSFDELFDIVEQISNDNRKTNGTEILRTSTGIALSDNNNASGDTNGSGRSEQPRKNESDGRRSDTGRGDRGNEQSAGGQTQGAGGRRSVGVQQPRTPGLFDNQGDSTEPNSQAGATRDGGSPVDNGRNGSADVQGSRTTNSGVGLNTPENPKETPKSNIEQAPAEPVKPKVEEKRELNTEKLSYRPHNTAFSLQSVAPAAMVEAMDNMLSKIEKEHGNIDAWVTTELGYDSVEDMHNALAAEQVDSVAMAIYQMKNGQGMIIGDQTGVGKGRQMAALIRWACRQGKKPIFITQKADLFSDIYRDLVDIGSGELRPFIFNSDGAMVDNNGVVVHKPLSASSQAKVFAGDELPDGYDFAVLTYSQVNTGDQISQDEAKQAAKDKGERYQKKKSKDGKPKATPKATFLRALAKDNYMFLDESHTAAGKSNTGYYFQSILKTAKAVTFASATFAKRPDTMPMYAIRTAMSKAKVKADELIKIIENGGVTLQEIMSRALTQAGQMVRRERDMSDVVTDWKTVDDPATVKKARENYDSTIEAFNAIIDFQKNWVSGYLDRLSRDLADVASSAGMRQGTEELGIKNVPFASKTYNYTKQLMLALKVDAIVDEVVKEIEAGRHPVIALENTMGSMLDDYAPGDTLEETTFAASLLKGLKGVLRYTITDEDGKQQQAEMKPEDLGPEGEAAYHAVEDLIRESTSGIFISPLDAITEKLKQRGYKVGELTGRQQYVELDDNTGKYVVRRRTDRDKKKMQREFNNGSLDVLILNKSASTGISLHASEKFSDQRQRTMIIAQPLADINDYMQMIGRIDRTGQVHRGYYINLGLPVPAEGRFLMMLSTKLKSLNANTTTSQENESNDVEAPDLLNKYGSRVVVEYLRDNPNIYLKMGEPLRNWQGAGASKLSVSELDSYEAQEDDARKITGYVALLPTDEQDAFYNDVVRRYTELIQYLNDTGANDLKISVLPLRARTIEKQISSEGADPKGDNPFAGHAYVEWVDMDVLKKPMKAAEIGKVIEQLNPSDNRVQQILDTVERETQAKMDKENERYEAAKKRAEEDIAAKAETINKQQKRTEEQKKEAIDKFASDRRQSVEESHQNMVNKIDANHDRLERYLKMFKVGDSVLVPDDLGTDAFLGSSPAIFCGFKAKDEGVTPSTTLAVFATLDGRRKIEVKLSDWDALVRINNMTEQNWDAAHEVTLSNWDSQIPSETRKQGFIMTGNILQAFADAGENGHVPGQLVTYTDIDGNVHDGILMNQHWEPSQLKGSTVPLKSRKEEIENLPVGEHVVSADGNVVIERAYRYYTISVPKSKKVGGQYYENQRLLDKVIDGVFYPSRGTLRADVPADQIGEVIDILSDLGVQMKSDTQVHFDTESEMGQAQANGRRFDEDINEGENKLNNKYKGESSQELFLSLSQKEGEDYYETVNEIGERVHSGAASLYGRSEKSWRGKTSRVASVAEVISAEHAKNTGANSIHEAPIGDRVVGTERKIEEWAKYDGCWLNEEEIAKESLGGKPISVRSQSKVYLSKDGKTAIKITNPYARNHYGMLAFLRNISVFNNLFPETAYTITGFTRDENGNFRVVMEQPFVEGTQYSEDEYRAKGIEQKVVEFFDKIGLYPYYNTFSNQVFEVSDIYNENVIVDNFGDVHIIDADVSLEPRFLISEYRDKALEYEDVSKRRFDEETKSENAKSKKNMQKSRIVKHIDNLVKKLGTKARTTVYHSFNELPADMKKHIRERERQGKKVRGWYENGHIYLYLPHIDSIYQAEKTIWHETVAHHGLRQLIGAENLDKLLKQLWLEHRDGEMGKWVAERMQKNGWALNEAIEEYLAREAEKNPFKEPGLWQRLRWMLADVLHKMGFASDPTISDIQYLFWVSQNQLHDNDPMGQIKQHAFLFNLEREAVNTPYVNMNATSVEDIYNPDAEGAYDDGVRHSEETDEEVIERLEKEPKIKVYRAMQLIDGKLYPPMAAKQGGKLVNPIELGKWEKADEHPEMADNNGKFRLDKGNGKSLKAAYNPYIHTSTTMLNDQFSEAQSRPNLVVVEVEVPESELTSGYKAEKAKDSVGKLEWKAGVIQGQLTGTREVILSRWDKPIRIVQTEEVAKSIAEQIKGKVDVMPTNVVTPAQREELEKLGVKFVETDNQGKIAEGENKGKTYSSVYSKKTGRRFDEDIEDPLTYSAKQVYNDRLNRVETVFSEAYQDAMVSLKTAQNAIAEDKEIPDSQNAYMAENLMHGKNKNEQDLFNRMFRDPLIHTINKILNVTGMNWGDVDRYVYTKSGLERNREFFVRDWLEAERNRRISKYEDLNPEEQDIYDSMAATIEDMFEDGDIDEEEKNKKLAQALQRAHQNYIDDMETKWVSLKDRNYLYLQAGDITFPDYLSSMDNFILDNIDGLYKPEEHDYSGFRAMFGDEEGNYDEAEIIDELMETEDAINSADYITSNSTADTLWEQINEATRYGLERYREAGMRSDEDIDRVEQMFHFYVPMRGFKENMGEDMYQYFIGKDKSKSYVGGLLKHAKGRGSEAQFPISTIFAMSYKAISDCNQNLVNQKFYRLCQANPNDLVVLSDSWAVYNEITGEWEESTPDIPEDATEDEVRNITLAWEEQMRELALENKAKKIKGKAEFDYKPMDKKKQSEHIVDVRINGQPKKMVVTSNPRMAQALNGQLRFEHGKNVFSRWNAAIKNMMATFFTSYSPTFALRNMFRDWTHFRTMLGVREGHGYAAQANKYYRQSLFKMIGLFKKYRNGTLDESKEMERDFKDFMDNGGITGFVFMQKIDDIQKEMENIYKKQKAGKPIRLNNNLWEKILGAVEALNEGIENNARFATYRASRHYAGRTKARSAYDAKEITVNFNRKGAGGKTAGFKSQNKRVEDAAKVFGVTSQILGEGRIFFNATVQAIATTFKNFQNPDGSLNKPYIAKWTAKYALPPFMFGLALPMINKALAAALGGDDDDPYANLPEWTRRKNLCFYIGNDNFITIPVGQELAAFLTLGDIVAGNTYAPDLKPVDRSWDDEMLGVMNTFSPVDVDTKITKGGLMEDPISEVAGRTFSVLAPLVAVEQNLGWTGRPIYREDKFGTDQYTPEYQMVYQNTNPVLVNASKLLHELGGGDDITRGKFEVNPAIVQYLWEQYTGGPGKVFSNTISIGKDAKDLFVEGEMPDFNIRKIEGLKAFVQQGDDRTAYYRVQAKYRKYKEDAERLYDAVKGYEGGAAVNPEYLLKLEQITKGEDFVRMQMVREADKQLSKIYKAANKAEGKERKELRKMYNEQVKQVVDMLDEAGQE